MCSNVKKKKEEAKFKDISKVLDMCPTENKERLFMLVWGLPQWLSSKETTCNAGDTSSIPGLGRSPGRGHGNPFQYSYLENPMKRRVWQATVHRVVKSWTGLKRQACMLS